MTGIQIDLSYRTLVYYLQEHCYARRIPRKIPEPPDRDAWTASRQTFTTGLLELHENFPAELLFGDEAGFEGDPRPRAKSVKR